MSIPELHCLLIDDDVDDHDIFRLCLEEIESNILLQVQSGGAEALHWLQSNTAYIPNWIFLDINMPLMSGLECLQELRAIERLNNSQVFMYSTSASPAIAAEAKQLGATRVVIKPAKTSDLKQLIHELVTGEPQP